MIDAAFAILLLTDEEFQRRKRRAFEQHLERKNTNLFHCFTCVTDSVRFATKKLRGVG
jgi:hypothetical protein